MWYIFEKEIVQGPQKQCSHVSDTQIHKSKYTNAHKYTNTEIQFWSNYQIDLTCDIFLKRWWYEDFKKNVPKWKQRKPRKPRKPWKPRKPRKKDQESLENQENQETKKTKKTKKNQENQWVSVGSSGYQWVPVGTSGYQWIPVGTIGYQWVLVGTTVPGLPRRPRPNQRCYLHLWCRFFGYARAQKANNPEMAALKFTPESTDICIIVILDDVRWRALLEKLRLAWDYWGATLARD